MSVNISDIETAILSLLQTHWPTHGGATAVFEFDIGSDFEDILKTPAISVTTERIDIRTIDDATFEITPVLTLYMAFKNVAGPKGRRSGIYPMVMGVIGILAGQTMDLDIEPLDPAGSATEIFHTNLKDKGLVAFKVSFSASFEIDKADFGDVAVRLLQIANHYYLNDREEAVASDIIEFEE